MHPKLHSLFYLWILLFFVSISCSKQVYKTGGSSSKIFPSPPDTARIQFLTSYSNSSDLIGNQSKFKTFITGQEELLSIIKPYGVAIQKDILFITDQGIAGLQIINLLENSFNYFIPGGRGQLKVPINCFVDTNGDLYVSDVGRKQVVIFDENLNYLDEISGSENFKPSDVYVIGDTILITDPNNNRVIAYDKSSHQKLFSFPRTAELGDDYWLYNPLNLWVAEDMVYITDFGDSRIKIFKMNGEFIKTIGSYGDGLAQFVRPKGIAVDHKKNVYVVDAGFENVQIFDKEGQLLMFFGGPYTGPGDMYLPANVTIDYDHLKYFEKYVDRGFELKYLIFVTNQYGPDKVNVYGRIEPKK